MSYRIYTAGQLRELAPTNGDHSLFGTKNDRFWLNAVGKDHCESLVAEVHDAEADIYIVISGEADLHLGGALVDPTSPEPGQHRANSLVGAACHRLHAGDVVIIPEGTPHMLDLRAGQMTYMVVKIVTANLQQ